MKHSITGMLLATLIVLPFLVACGTTDPTPTMTPTIAPVGAPSSSSAPVIVTATHPGAATPIQSATVPSTPTTGRGGTAAATPRPASTATRAGQGPRYSLVRGQAVTLPNSDLTIHFVEVTNDSRCPDSPNVACFWAGEATVRFEITSGIASETISLTMPGLTNDTTQKADNPKTHVTYKGYVIQIASLEPQPTFIPPASPDTTPIAAPSPTAMEITATILVSAMP